jgi:hypothetical protein
LASLIETGRKSFPADDVLKTKCTSISTSQLVGQFITLGENVSFCVCVFHSCIFCLIMCFVLFQVRSDVNRAHGADIITNMLHSYVQGKLTNVVVTLLLHCFKTTVHIIRHCWTCSWSLVCGSLSSVDRTHI